MSVEALNRTLEQELFALLRGASLECLVCQAEYRRSGQTRLQLSLQAG